ncbi:MAG: type IV secretory system conjugative DNA transfer family protein [Lachnospiraceae bacterium]|nr:type IV secretory system conjugative DNA transfer family protein [Lachnospiraceae bacterium]
MRQDKFSKTNVLLYGIGLIPVVWLALLTAPAFGGGLPSLIGNLAEIFKEPFHIVWCEDSLKTVLIFIAAYGMGIGIYLSTARNYRRREEHGSAKWGNAGTVNKKYRDPEPEKNKILTKSVEIGLNGRKHMRNLNVLVCGGSGAGKTRFYAKPNVMQGNTSFVVLDPKGEILRDTGKLLEEKGYVIKVLDLINTDNSDCYNPFEYIRSDDDILKLVTNLFKNTTPKNAQPQDPFWDNAAQMMLLALMFYLYHEAPKEEQNFQMIMEMIREGDVSEEDSSMLSPLDQLFEKLGKREPTHIAYKHYTDYRRGAGKTLKSIQITLLSHLSKFNLDSITRITSYDEMELGLMGDRKTALFAVIPNNDTSFNFLVGMLYTQLFQQLDYKADVVYKGGLKVPVHLVMDEFANIALPDNFEIELATMRSRNISASIILQNLAQLKALYEKQWENIIGNCDSFLYLGGNELSTHEYITKLLGKETIDMNTYGQSKGRNGNYSTNWQITGRELMTPDEVRRLDNKYALLFIRGEMPVKDFKYDLKKHPNIAMTTDGGAKPYSHEKKNYNLATLVFDESLMKAPKTDPEDIEEDEFVILTEEEIYEIMYGKRKPISQPIKIEEERENEGFVYQKEK